MARIDPLDRNQLGEHEPGFAAVEAAMGFVPNSMFTMARVPGLMPAFLGLARTVLYNDTIPPPLAQMVALVTSVASGCRYCQAHTGHSAERLGVPAEKLAAIWEFETSDHFDAAERAALRVAFRAGQVPNAVTDDDIAECSRHYSEEQITAIVAVCALFGYLNRWNDTMATQLEAKPVGFAAKVLGGGGWTAGKHA